MDGTGRRWTLAVVGLGALLLVAEAGLAHRGLAALDREAVARREQVASRVFGEIERELDAFLAHEEDRPFTHWRAFRVPEDALEGTLALAVSPLATPSTEPGVIGHVQIDPDGSLHTPLRPRNEELARLSTAWAETPELTTRIADLERRVGPAVDETVPPIQIGSSPFAAIDGRDLQQSLGSYGEVDQAFNKLGSRAQRPSKSVQAPATSVQNFQQEEGNVYQTQVACQINGIDNATARDLISWSPQDVGIGPLHRVGGEADSIVLLRDVRIGGERWRQGVVLDQATFAENLASQVLDHADLRQAIDLRWGETEDPEALSYRFAEPFGDLAASVRVHAEPEGVADQRWTVLAFAFGLAAATIAALAGLRLAVGAVLRDARRRQEFAAAVSHELKTPLTAIRLHAEMLRDGLVVEPGKIRAYHGAIVAESERLSRLVGNVLELARLERRERQVALVVGDPGDVLAEVARIAEPHAQAQGFVLMVERDASLPAARFDRDALIQVVLNLVDNALKHAVSAGTKTIMLRAHNGADGPIVEVVDRGPGIEAEDLRRLWRPFERGSRAQGPGIGLGLSLVRGLVEAMGGSVEARNADGGGFVVRCRLLRA